MNIAPRDQDLRIVKKFLDGGDGRSLHHHVTRRHTVYWKARAPGAEEFKPGEEVIDALNRLFADAPGSVTIEPDVNRDDGSTRVEIIDGRATSHDLGEAIAGAIMARESRVHQVCVRHAAEHALDEWYGRVNEPDEDPLPDWDEARAVLEAGFLMLRLRHLDPAVETAVEHLELLLGLSKT